MSLRKVDETTTEIKEVLLKASIIQLSPSVGIGVLATSCFEKKTAHYKGNGASSHPEGVPPKIAGNEQSPTQSQAASEEGGFSHGCCPMLLHEFIRCGLLHLA